MESEDQLLKVEICEKCYEHELTLKHSQAVFIEAYDQLISELKNEGMRIIKNVAPRYLRKAANTKVSTKRHIDTNTDKIVEYPRKGSFEIYYLNILIFSKLQNGNFPHFPYLRQIVNKIKKIYFEDPSLKGFERFRDMEFQWRRRNKVTDPLYDYLCLHCPTLHSKQQLDDAFAKIRREKDDFVTERKKIIYPYSFYAQRQKQCKLESIYCPATPFALESKTYRLPSPAGSGKSKSAIKYQRKEKTCETHRKDLFDLVRLGCEKKIDDKKMKRSLNSQNLTTFKAKSKQLYFSYLNCAKKINGLKNARNIKTANTHRQMGSNLSKTTERKSANNAVTVKNMKKISQSFVTVKNGAKQANTNIEFRVSEAIIVDKLGDNSDLRKSPDEIEKEEVQSFVEKVINECMLKQDPSLLEQISAVSVDNNDNNGDDDGKKSPLGESTRPKDQSQFFQEMQKMSNNCQTNRFSSASSFEQNNGELLRRKNQIGNGRSSFFSVKSHHHQKSVSKIKENTLKLWGAEQTEQVIREPANILKKFSQPAHFNTKLYENVWENSDNVHVKFEIRADQILKQWKVSSLRQIMSPKSFKLFPDRFMEIDNYSSKLVEIVNIMMKSNSLILSRIFENKKLVNPYGVYCVWLRDLRGVYRPVFVNDQFAFDTNDKPIYSGLGTENSIWFMILEKAVAKVVGGYEAIKQTSLSNLMKIVLGCPVVEFGSLNLQKILKVFQQKNFFNKMAAFYGFQTKSQKNKLKTDQIIGFTPNQANLKQSTITIKTEQSQNSTINLRQFLLWYDEISLVFFNYNYFVNQIQFSINTTVELLSCRFSCDAFRSNCYFLLNNFPIRKVTKATIYRQLSDQEAQITEGMNPLCEENKKYIYVGEISKTANFFFEAQLSAGDYICIMQGDFTKGLRPNLSVYSQSPIFIFDENSHNLRLEKSDENSELGKNKKKSKKISPVKSAPKFIIERKVSSDYGSDFVKSASKANNFRVKKQFIVDKDSDSDKENSNTNRNQRK